MYSDRFNDDNRMISLLIAFLLTPISCLLLWGRMIVTVDAFMHACILGSMLHIVFELPLQISMSITAFLFAILFQYFKRHIEKNEALQIIAIVFMNVTFLMVPREMVRILFGNVNSIDMHMVYGLLMLTLIVYIFVYVYYNRIVLFALSPVLDRNMHGDNLILQFGMLFLICLVLGSVIEYTGAMFIVPMIVMPGIIARSFSTSPAYMFVLTLIVNLSVVCVSEVVVRFYELPINQVIIIINFVLLLLMILKKEIIYLK